MWHLTYGSSIIFFHFLLQNADIKKHYNQDANFNEFFPAYIACYVLSPHYLVNNSLKLHECIFDSSYFLYFSIFYYHFLSP